MYLTTKDMIMIDTNTPQPQLSAINSNFPRQAIFNELQRINGFENVQGEQSISMVQAKVVDPRYEPQNGIYETEYNGFEIALGPQTLIHTQEGNV
jgi:hypothetical protein